MTAPEFPLALGTDLSERQPDGSIVTYRALGWAQGPNGGGSHFTVEKRIYPNDKK